MQDLKITTMRLGQVDRDLLAAEARRLGTTSSAIIRALIREHLPQRPQDVRR